MYWRTGAITVVCIGLSVLLQTTSTAYCDAADIFNLISVESAKLDESILNGGKIWDLQFYNGKIYIGYGDITSSNGVSAVFYNPESNTFSQEYDYDQCLVSKYERLGAKLYSGTKSLVRRWDGNGPALGNLFTRTNQGWEKSSPIVDVWIMYDIELFEGDLYVAANYYNPCCAGHNSCPSDPLTPDICCTGAVFRTPDGGLTWQQAYTLPHKYDTATAIYWICCYKDRLYAFPGVKSADGLPVLDAFNENDCIVYSNSEWGYEDLLSVDNLFGIAPIRLNDKLLLIADIDEGQGRRPTKRVYAYNGTTAEEVRPTYNEGTEDHILPIEWRISDYCIRARRRLSIDKPIPGAIKPAFWDIWSTDLIRTDSMGDRQLLPLTEECLYLLINKNTMSGSAYFIIETCDLQHWNYYKICNVYDDNDPYTSPRAIEADLNNFYVITLGGTIYKMTSTASTQNHGEFFKTAECASVLPHIR